MFKSSAGIMGGVKRRRQHYRYAVGLFQLYGFNEPGYPFLVQLFCLGCGEFYIRRKPAFESLLSLLLRG
ncbi:hypothetical protein ES703_74632 [subsurface metagenome]